MIKEDMNLELFVSELLEKNVALWVEKGDLKFRGPKGVINTHIQDKLSRSKEDVIAFLGEGKKYLTTSYSQQRLFFLDRLVPDNPFYNIPLALSIDGEIDIDAFRKAIRSLVERHEILRTTYRLLNGKPVQVIQSEWKDPFVYEELEHSSCTDRDYEKEADLRIEKEAKRTFDLDSDLMIRALLLKLRNTRYNLIINIHHIACDGWSLGVLYREINTLYKGFKEGNPAPLPELKLQYSDYALWQREWLVQGELKKQLGFWEKTMSGAPDALEFPCDFPRQSIAKFAGAKSPFSIPKPIADRLKVLSKSEGVTSYMVMLTVFNILLFRYSGQRDIVIGSPIAGRAKQELESLIGLFVNQLAIRTQINGTETFLDLLKQVKNVTLDAYEHQDLPFEYLVEKLHPKRDMSRNPIFQVSFALQNASKDKLALEDAGLKRKGIETSISRFDLELQAAESEDGITGFFIYDSDLFKGSTIRMLAGHFETLFSNLMCDPEQSIASVSMLSTEEHAYLNRLSSGLKSDSDFTSVVRRFENQTERTPDAIAVISGNKRISYTELNRKANRLASWLLKSGVSEEDNIGLYLSPSPDIIVSILAILKARCAYVPLDISLPIDRLAYMIADSEIKLLITTNELVKELPECKTELCLLDLRSDAIASEPADNPSGMITADHLVYSIYTSGSTGKPKGTMITHGGLSNYLDWCKHCYPQSPGEEVLLYSSISFDLTVTSIFPPIVSGMTIRIESEDQAPQVLVSALRENPNTAFLKLTPAHIDILNTQMNGERFENLPEALIIGGENLNGETIKPWFSAGGDISFYNEYGPTETVVGCCVHKVSAADDLSASIPIGTPIINTRLYVLDPFFNPVPPGIPGELYIAGAGVSRGYRNRPGLTAEKFLPDLFGKTPGSRMYRSGDRVKINENGALVFLERIDQQLKIRGYRIEPGEIETILNQYPGIRKSVVNAWEDEPGDKRLVAYLIADSKDVALAEMKTEYDSNRVSQWQGVFNDTFSDDWNEEDKTFNITGWTSSYSGELISAAEMNEWVDNIVERILSLKGKRIYEIGCGTGLLLLRIAPHCEHYHGCDFSESVLSQLQKGIEYSGLKNVSFERREAADFTGLPSREYDTVVINSVIQYFPSVDYLITVLKGAVELTADGGAVVVGDVRSRELLDCFLTSVQLEQAESTWSLKELQQMVRRTSMQEEELVVDPVLFKVLKNKIPRVSHVEIVPKWGTTDNELSKFRYEVILHVEKEVREISDAERLDWIEDRLSPDILDEILAQGNRSALCVTNVPNERLYYDLAALELIDELKDSGDVGVLKERLNALNHSRIPLDLFKSISESRRYHLLVYWTGIGDYFDLVFTTLSYDPDAPPSFFKDTHFRDRAWIEYSNNPEHGMIHRRMIPKVRNFLKERLPDYMVPSSYMLLDKMPLAPSGKVDLNALPEPDGIRSGTDGEYVAPRNSTEEVLAQCWQEILGIEKIGVQDNFFELGGHSLLAIQVISEIGKRFQIDLPLKSLFEAATVETLSLLVCQKMEDPEKNSSDMSSLPDVLRHPDDRYKPFPLTDIQQAYWVGRSSQIELGNVSSHGYSEVEYHGLDLSRYENAWRRLIERHDMLRVIIRPDGLQEVLADVDPYTIRIYDMVGKDQLTVSTHLNGIREEMSHQVLTTDQWPIFDIRATLLENGVIRLHSSFDALITDGWSWTVIRRELSQFYSQPDLSLPELDLLFRDYVLSEIEFRKSALYKNSLKYWKNRLKTLSPAPDLPLAVDPSALVSPSFERNKSTLDPVSWSRLKGFASKFDLTPSIVLLSLFGDVLSVWSKNPNFTVNLTLFNRLPLHSQVNDIVGDFTTLTLLEMDKGGSESFTDRVKKVQARLWEDLDHRYVSGVKVLRDLARKQGVGLKALMPVVFTSTLTHSVKGEETGTSSENGTKRPVEAELVYSISQTPQVWIDHQVFERDGSLHFIWDSVKGLFPKGMIENMFAVYCQLLRSIANSEAAWGSRTWPMIPAEQMKLRSEVNRTERPLTGDTLHSLFIDQVKRTPDNIAVIQGDIRLDYRSLYRQSSRVAARLKSLGVTKNALVGVVMDKGWEQIVAVLGILMSGAAYLPIDPKLPKERIRYLMTFGEIGIYLTQSWYEGGFEDPDSIQALVVRSENNESDEVIDIETSTVPEDLAYVIFTSGSTGLPKGVMIDHRGAVNTVLDVNQRFSVTEKDRILGLSALNFDLSVYDIFGLLAAGGSIVLPEKARQKDPSHWLELIETEKVTLWDTVPALMEILVEFVEAGKNTLPGHLRLVFMSGDWIPVTLPDRIRKLGSEIEVFSGGGATEASIWSIMYPIKTVDNDWPSIPYGKPMSNQHFYVLDSRLANRPFYVPGELYIGGVGVALGYWKDPEKTNRSFIIHPETGERLYRTGDMGLYLPDGNIRFLGREDLQVKVRGYRIELGEIESALVQHPAVNSAVVSVSGDASGDKKLVAYVVQDQKAKEEMEMDGFDYLIDDETGVVENPMDRLRFKLCHERVRPASKSESEIDLPRPDQHSEDIHYLLRRSFRRFNVNSIDRVHLSGLLYSLSARKFNGVAMPKYRYGSAGSLYPVQTFVYIKEDRIDGLAQGCYYYNPDSHRLNLIHRGSVWEKEIYYGGNRDIFEQSAFAIFFVGNLNRIEPLYGSWSKEFCMLEAGLMTQLLEMTAPENGLGLCQIGGFQFDSVKGQFGLDDRHIYLHGLVGGGISQDQRTLESLVAESEQLNLMVSALETSDHAGPSEVGADLRGVNTSGSSESLKDFLKNKIPEYMVPSVFVYLDQLPLTANGKLDRNHLPAPETVVETETKHFVAPTSELEHTIATAWKEVLGRGDIGIHDNIFDLGGSSFHIVQIFNKLNEQLNSELSLIKLFEYPTISAFSGFITEGEQGNKQLEQSEVRTEIRLKKRGRRR